jgi:3-oxosteroid 1-dehydrogenase
MPKVDFVCVGGGLGGLAAAARAAHLGLSVVVLEKTPYVGGVAAYSGGAVWAPGNHLARAEGLPDDVEDAERYVDYVGGRGLPHDHRLRQAFLTQTAKAIEFYTTKLGLNFQRLDIPEQYYPQTDGSTTGTRHVEATVDGVDLGDWEPRLRFGPYQQPYVSINDMVRARAAGRRPAEALDEAELAARTERGFLTRGRGLAGAFLKAVLKLGVPVHTDAPVVRLLIDGDADDGVVRGVVSRSPDGAETTWEAVRGVLLATGSYGSAPWAAAMEGLPELFEQAPPILDGDGLVLAETTSAAVVRAGHTFCTLGFESSTAVHPGTDVPLHFPVIEALGRPHIIVVNGDAQRFGDESFYGTFASFITAYDGSRKAFANWPPYAIMDDQFRRNGYEFGWMAGWPTDDLVQAESLVELAGKLGLNEAALAGTVERYNQAVDVGVDADFGRGSLPIARAYGDPGYSNPNLGRIDTPPFWGARLRILTAGIYSHGLSIDDDARVLDRLGQPVRGLYATGNLVAHTEMPFGYENGFANGRNIAYAYLAATHAAG